MIIGLDRGQGRFEMDGESITNRPPKHDIRKGYRPYIPEERHTPSAWPQMEPERILYIASAWRKLPALAGFTSVLIHRRILGQGPAEHDQGFLGTSRPEACPAATST